MRRTTIMLPEELRERAMKRAHRYKKSLGELIRESLEKALQETSDSEWDADPLFADKAVYDGPAPKDLAANHDRYLHEEYERDLH